MAGTATFFLAAGVTLAVVAWNAVSFGSSILAKAHPLDLSGPLNSGQTVTVTRVSWPKPLQRTRTVVRVDLAPERSSATPTAPQLPPIEQHPPRNSSIRPFAMPSLDLDNQSPNASLAAAYPISQMPSIPPPAFANPPRAVSAVPAAKKAQVLSYVPPRPLKWVKPDLKVLGVDKFEPMDVKVKVRIDETGRVIAAHALIDGPTHNEKLMAAAAAAVRQWVFEPAKMRGMDVPSEDTIVIRLAP